MRLHGWLLAAWALSVGVLANAALLHLMHVHSMAARYAIGMGTMYLLGFVLGGYWYLKWWYARKQSAAVELPAHASPDDQLAYEREREKFNKKLSKFEWLGDFGNVPIGEDPLSALLGILILAVFFVFVLFLLGHFPLIATEALAGHAAEIVLEFIIGGVALRKLSQPMTEDDYWGVTLRRSLPSGLFLIAAAALFGWAVQQHNPEASTLLQALG